MTSIINTPVISQKEMLNVLQAWKQCRREHSTGRPFFMLVQWVPVGGDGGGKVVCRKIMSPIRIENNDNGT